MTRSILKAALIASLFLIPSLWAELPSTDVAVATRDYQDGEEAPILDRNGSGTLTRGELEQLCHLTAQRMSQLNEFAAPEFSDRNLFKQFIALLRDEGIITTNADEKLEFNEKIQQISNDAKFILSKEIRHGILRVAPQVLTHPDQE